MIHAMKLKDKYFDYIKYGTKRYEIRLNDEKRKIIKDGDFIEFQKEPELKEKIIVRADSLKHFNNFSDLIHNIDISLLASSKTNSEDLLNDLEVFYPKEKQEENGVVAIHFSDIIVNVGNTENIDENSHLFDSVKKNYNNFDKWIKKVKNENIEYFFTGEEKNMASIMILKLDEIDSKQFRKSGKITKIRTLNVCNRNRGIGSFYIELALDIAKKCESDYIYLTIKNNPDMIKFIEKRGFIKYDEIDGECIYYRSL